MTYLLAFLAIGIMVFVHELGHFLAAKYCKIPVKVFAIGFGPSLFKRKIGETEYKFNIFPLGGYVSLEGEENSESEKGFLNQHWFKRFLVLVAGIVFNILFSILLFTFIYSAYGVPTTGVLIQDVIDNTYASEYLEENDHITTINGKEVTANDLDNISNWIEQSEGKPVDITVSRNGKEYNYNIPLSEYEDKQILGISYNASTFFVKEGLSFKNIFIKPLEETVDNVKLIFKGFEMLANGEVESGDVTGPIGIIKVTSDIAESSFPLFLYWIAILGINLGIMNALPIPALDGGQILFLFLEIVFGKVIGKEKWNKKVVTTLNALFLFLLLGFMVFVTIGDVVRLFK